MAGLMNLWSVANVVWFRVVRKPLDDISKMFPIGIFPKRQQGHRPERLSSKVKVNSKLILEARPI